MILATVLTLILGTSAFASEKKMPRQNQAGAPLREDDYLAPVPPPEKPVQRDLLDLQYMPENGQVFGSLLYGHSYRTSALNNDRTGEEYLNSKIDVEAYKLRLGYGITEAVTIALATGYAPLFVRENTYNAVSGQTGTSLFAADGMTDPEAQLQYRIQSQDNFAGNLDLNVSISPGFAESTSPTSHTRGNVARGGTEVSVGLDFGRKYHLYSYSVGLNYSAVSESSSTNPDTNQVSTTSNTSQLDVSARGQLRLLENVALNAYVVRQSHSSQSTTSTTSVYKNVDSYSTLSAGLSASISMMRNHLAAQVGYLHDVPSKVSGLSGTLQLTETARGDTVQVGLMGAF